MSSDNEQKWVRMLISETCNISISQYAEILNSLVRLGTSVPVLGTIISGLSGYDITVVNVPEPSVSSISWREVHFLLKQIQNAPTLLTSYTLFALELFFLI